MDCGPPQRIASRGLLTCSGLRVISAVRQRRAVDWPKSPPEIRVSVTTTGSLGRFRIPPDWREGYTSIYELQSRPDAR